MNTVQRTLGLPVQSAGTRTRLGLLMLVWLVPMCVWAQLRMELVELKHRTGQEILPVLLPLLAPEGGASAYENKIVLRATAAKIAEVRPLIARLDRPPRQLLITLQADNGVNGSTAEARLALSPSSVGVGLGTQQRQDAQRSQQRLRVMEGHEARIYWTGVTGTVGSTQDADVAAFSVVPRLQDRQVQVEIHAQQPLGGNEAQRLTTVVVVPLNAWVEVGGAIHRLTQSSAGLDTIGRDQVQSRSRLLMKVEELRER